MNDLSSSEDPRVKIWAAVDWSKEGHILTWAAEHSPKHNLRSIFDNLDFEFEIGLNTDDHNFHPKPPERAGVYVFKGIIKFSGPDNLEITFKGEWKTLMLCPVRPLWSNDNAL